MLNRRFFLISLLMFPITAEAARKTTTFRFRIKTKSGSIVGNVTIQAFDVDAAKVKLKKRYPDCIILNTTS